MVNSLLNLHDDYAPDSSAFSCSWPNKEQIGIRKITESGENYLRVTPGYGVQG
jgi:hypothetical protein